MSERVHVGLGSNLGDAGATLDSAIRQLAALSDTHSVQASPRYRTQPMDADGPDFLNAVVQLHTRLSPHELLRALQAIEAAHGRERPYPNAPRTLDLDLLLYGELIVQDTALTVPHPRLHERAFVLAPLADLCPDAVVPGLGTVRSLLAGIQGQRIQRLDPFAP